MAAVLLAHRYIASGPAPMGTANTCTGFVIAHSVICAEQSRILDFSRAFFQVASLTMVCWIADALSIVTDSISRTIVLAC